MRRKIDWERVKTEYITGNESILTISRRLGISKTAIGEKCKEEGWVAERKKYRDTTVTNAVRRISRTREDEIVASIEIADMIDAAVRELLVDPDRIAALMSTRQPGKELEAMARAITANDDLRRMCRGIMNPRDEARAKLEREKFEYEKAKDERDSAEGSAIRIEIADELKELAK